MLTKHRVSLRQRLCSCYSDKASQTKNTHSIQSKSSQNKRSKFRKLEKLATFPTLSEGAANHDHRRREPHFEGLVPGERLCLISRQAGKNASPIRTRL